MFCSVVGVLFSSGCFVQVCRCFVQGVSGVDSDISIPNGMSNPACTESFRASKQKGIGGRVITSATVGVTNAPQLSISPPTCAERFHGKWETCFDLRVDWSTWHPISATRLHVLITLQNLVRSNHAKPQIPMNLSAHQEDERSNLRVLHGGHPHEHCVLFT